MAVNDKFGQTGVTNEVNQTTETFISGFTTKEFIYVIKISNKFQTGNIRTVFLLLL
jgi:predicted nucleic-acid-binding protein